MPARDRIAMRHPALPGQFVTVPRSTFEGSYSHNDWVEAKSPAARAAADEATRPPKVDDTTTPKEGKP